MEIIHTEPIVHPEIRDKAKYLEALVLVPIHETPENLLSKARPASIALDWRCDILEPTHYDRVVEDGSRLHVLDEAGNITQTYNTNSALFVAVWWETMSPKSLEQELAKIQAKYFSDSIDEGVEQ